MIQRDSDNYQCKYACLMDAVTQATDNENFEAAKRLKRAGCPRLRDLDFTTLDFIFIPLHLRLSTVSQHWGLIVAEPKKNKVTLLDSMATLNMEGEKKLLKVKNFFDYLGLPPMRPCMLNLGCGFDQSQGLGCGIYVCVFVRYIISGIDQFAMSVKDIFEYRNHMYLEIQKMQLLPYCFPSLNGFYLGFSAGKKFFFLI